MKKILILTYFFPPSNLAGSYRAESWAEYLHEFGYYPVIITRRWDHQSGYSTDISSGTGREVLHEKCDQYEVYRLPYTQNLRDKIHTRYGHRRWSLIRRTLSFMEVWLQNYFNIVIPYRNIYKQAKQVLNEDNDIKILLVTAGPFTLFKFGNKLHRRCGIPWVADYRDEWSTNVITRSHTIPERFIRWVESHSEKRWLKSASKIITVSEPIAKRIQQYTGIPAEVVLNGFDEKIYNHKEYDLYDEFTITYNGTLYSIQPYQIFLEAFKRIVDRFKSTIAIRIRFPGLDHDEKMGAEIREYLRGYEENYEISGRTTKEAMAEIQGRSHCLLSISYTGSSGFYSTKLFEYLASGRPVILCPGDHDVMEKLITEAKAGYICNSSDEAFVRMKQLIDDYVQNKITRRNPDWAVISEYSRRKQTEILSQILEKMLR